MIRRVCICCGDFMREVIHPQSQDANLCPSCRKLADALCETGNRSLIEEAEPANEPLEEGAPWPESERSVTLYVPPSPRY